MREEFLFDLDPAHRGNFRQVEVVEFTSYPGYAPSFTVMLSDGSVFADIPPHAFASPDSIEDDWLELTDLVYHNCPDERVVVVINPHFAQEQVQVYLKRLDRWETGSYLFTVDWYTGNDLLNAILLPTGQIALLPYHKLKMQDGTRAFEPFRKLHHDWQV